MPTELSEQNFNLFCKLIKKEVGISLRPTKRNILGPKLAYRLQRLEIPSYLAYYRYLLKPEGLSELRHLINIVTINETDFFRGTVLFELLQKKIIPEIIRRNNSSKRVRIWSSGCSSGQEPYSIAMLLEEIGICDPYWNVKILATDINTSSLKTAFHGKYSLRKVAGIPSDYLTKYFYKEIIIDDENYRVKDTIKKKILFRRLNLLKSLHRVNGPIDLILCRNVLIYLDHTARKQIINNFHRLLGPKCYLCFGGSESPLGVDNRFHLIDSGVYQKSDEK